VAAVLEGVEQVDPAALPRWGDAEAEAGDDREQHGETEHGQADTDGVDARKIVREPDLQRLRAPPGEQHAQRTAGEGEEEVFHEEAQSQPARRGAECGADGDVPPAARGARELEIGDVGAGDQQHERHGAEQQPERGARLTRELFLQRHELRRGVRERQRNARAGRALARGRGAVFADANEAGCAVGRGFLGRCAGGRDGGRAGSGTGPHAGAIGTAGHHLPHVAHEAFPIVTGNRVQLLLGDGEVGAGLDAAEHALHLDAELAGGAGGAERQRAPELHGVDEFERRREHADDGVGDIVELHDRAQRVVVAGELGLPGGVAEDGDGRGAGFEIRGVEEPAAPRAHAEHGKETAGDGGGGDAHGAVAALERDRAIAVGGQGTKRFWRGLLPRNELDVGHHVAATRDGCGALLGQFAREHEVAGFRVGQRLEQDGVDDAKDGGVGADAEGEEQDDERRESGVGAERAQGGFEEFHGGVLGSKRRRPWNLSREAALSFFAYR